MRPFRRSGVTHPGAYGRRFGCRARCGVPAFGCAAIRHIRTPGRAPVPGAACTDNRGGGEGNRTPVQGFAGPCLNHSATPPEGTTIAGTPPAAGPRQIGARAGSTAATGATRPPCPSNVRLTHCLHDGHRGLEGTAVRHRHPRSPALRRPVGGVPLAPETRPHLVGRAQPAVRRVPPRGRQPHQPPPGAVLGGPGRPAQGAGADVHHLDGRPRAHTAAPAGEQGAHTPNGAPALGSHP
jgi:hypothetical protein